MSLITEISRIKSMMRINEPTMLASIQTLVNNSLEKIQDEAFEMGLGEMDELNEVNSVDEIKITNMKELFKVHVVYVDLYVNSDRRDFHNIIGEIEYSVGKYIPNITIAVNNIIDNRTLDSDMG